MNSFSVKSKLGVSVNKNSENKNEMFRERIGILSYLDF